MEMKMEYIHIGRIVNTHGIKGEVKIQSYSDFDAERYQKGNTVYVLFEKEYIPFQVETFRTHKGMSLVSFNNYKDINLIEKYKNCDVYILEEERKPLKHGYYRSQLKGLTVEDEDGNVIGRSMYIEETNGAQNNLRIERENHQEFLIPFIDEFIKNIDLDEKKIIVHLEEGLL